MNCLDPCEKGGAEPGTEPQLLLTHNLLSVFSVHHYRLLHSTAIPKVNSWASWRHQHLSLFFFFLWAPVPDTAFLTVVLQEGYGKAFPSPHWDKLSGLTELLGAGPVGLVQSRHQGRCEILFAQYGRGNIQMASGDRLWGWVTSSANEAWKKLFVYSIRNEPNKWNA